MMELPINQILNGDALQHLKELPDQCVNMVMTSPPYWALRDYGSAVEIVWDENKNCKHEWEESTTKISRMTGMNEREQIEKGNIKSKFVQEWDRPSRREFQNRTILNICPVCKKEFEGKPNQKFCSIECLNTLSNEERQMTQNTSNFCKKCGAWKGQLGLEPTFILYIKHLCDIFDEVKRVIKDDGVIFVNLGDTYYSISGGKFMNDNIGSKDRNKLKGLAQANRLKSGDELEQKNLCNIPARFSIEMQNRGWILRNVIIWNKPNCMPSSVKDRFTIDYEYLFFFVKNRKYYFKTQLEPIKSVNDKRVDKGREEHIGKSAKGIYSTNATVINSEGRNKRCVWYISTKPFSEAHFATYPEELCEIPIKAGCPEGGIVMDIFFGAGTTGLVSLKQNKRFIGIELNPEYIKIAQDRLKPYLEQRQIQFAKDGGGVK